jgi:hypothetical protein
MAVFGPTYLIENHVNNFLDIFILQSTIMVHSVLACLCAITLLPIISLTQVLHPAWQYQ